MAGIEKLDEAFQRFEAALRLFEDAVGKKVGGAEPRERNSKPRPKSLRKEKSRLTHELDLVRSKAGELVDTSKNAAGKIDAAMSRIRAVLHSNTPE